jgi:hypothetical protein
VTNDIEFKARNNNLIVTDGLTSKITFNELKVKITPFEYGQDGEGLNNIKQRNSNNIANLVNQ